MNKSWREEMERRDLDLCFLSALLLPPANLVEGSPKSCLSVLASAKARHLLMDRTLLGFPLTHSLRLLYSLVWRAIAYGAFL